MSIWAHLLDPGIAGGVASGMVAEADGTVRVIHGQDDENIRQRLKSNKDMRNSGHDGYTADRSMRFAARVDKFFVDLWRAKHGVDAWNPNHREKVLELLDSPEYCHLKAVDAHLSKGPVRTYFTPRRVPLPPKGTIIKPGE